MGESITPFTSDDKTKNRQLPVQACYISWSVQLLASFAMLYLMVIMLNPLMQSCEPNCGYFAELCYLKSLVES